MVYYIVENTIGIEMSISEKRFIIPEYANKLRNRLNRWRGSINKQ